MDTYQVLVDVTLPLESQLIKGAAEHDDALEVPGVLGLVESVTI